MFTTNMVNAGLLMRMKMSVGPLTVNRKYAYEPASTNASWSTHKNTIIMGKKSQQKNHKCM